MRFKLFLAALLMLIVAVFSIQNAGVVEVKFFGWSFVISLALLVFAALAVGFVAGWALTGALRLRKRKRKDDPLPPPSPSPPPPATLEP